MPSSPWREFVVLVASFDLAAVVVAVESSVHESAVGLAVGLAVKAKK